jgi:tetratricopeptide (TPR) repeat protein
MINLANCYEQQQRYAKAIIWYEFALWVEPDSDDAHYGISLCCLKDGDSQRAHKHIEEAIKIIKDKEEFKEDKIHLTYMRAMCLKLMKRYHQSEETYVSMSKSFNREEGNKIAKYIFGMILMPLETNRKKIMEYVEGFQGILEQYESIDLDRRKLI